MQKQSGTLTVSGTFGKIDIFRLQQNLWEDSILKKSVIILQIYKAVIMY